MKLCGESRPRSKVLCIWYTDSHTVTVKVKNIFFRDIVVIYLLLTASLTCELAEYRATLFWFLRLVSGPPPRWICCMPAAGICPANHPPETSLPLCCPCQSVWKGRQTRRVMHLVKPPTARKPFPHLHCLPGQLACKCLRQCFSVADKIFCFNIYFGAQIMTSSVFSRF